MSFFGTSDFMLEVAKGNIPGHLGINKFGRNPDTDTGSVPEDVWDRGGIWVPPTQARIHDFVSTSAQDAGTLVSSGTATGGSTTTMVDSGATFVADGVVAEDMVLIDSPTVRHAYIETVDSETTLTLYEFGGALSGDTYRVVASAGSGTAAVVITLSVDENYDSVEENILLNGTTPVATTNIYARIHRFASVFPGTPNVGTITATAKVDLTVTSQIVIGNGQTFQATYTVPRGKIGYLTQVYAGMNIGGGSAASADIILFHGRSPMKHTTHTKHYFGLSSSGSSFFPLVFIPPIPFEAQSDIILRVEQVTANNIDISGGFDLVVIDD